MEAFKSCFFGTILFSAIYLGLTQLGHKEYSNIALVKLVISYTIALPMITLPNLIDMLKSYYYGQPNHVAGNILSTVVIWMSSLHFVMFRMWRGYAPPHVELAALFLANLYSFFELLSITPLFSDVNHVISLISGFHIVYCISIVCRYMFQRVQQQQETSEVELVTFLTEENYSRYTKPLYIFVHRVTHAWLNTLWSKFKLYIILTSVLLSMYELFKNCESDTCSPSKYVFVFLAFFPSLYPYLSSVMEPKVIPVTEPLLPVLLENAPTKELQHLMIAYTLPEVPEKVMLQDSNNKKQLELEDKDVLEKLHKAYLLTKDKLKSDELARKLADLYLDKDLDSLPELEEPPVDADKDLDDSEML
jgi:hypothetical protein